MNGRLVWAVETHEHKRSHVFPDLATHEQNRSADSGTAVVCPFAGAGEGHGAIPSPCARVVSRPRGPPGRLQSHYGRAGDVRSYRTSVPEPGGAPLGESSRRFSSCKAARGHPEAAFVVFGVRGSGSAGGWSGMWAPGHETASAAFGTCPSAKPAAGLGRGSFKWKFFQHSNAIDPSRDVGSTGRAPGF